MQRKQKTTGVGYHRIDMMESEGYDGAQSASYGERGNQNGVENLMEKILDRNNLNKAYLQVIRNKGAAGVDAMTYDQLYSYLKENREDLVNQLREGTYKPKPVRRVEIPKPDGGVRKLGVPTAVDRLIQQAINQVLQRIFDPKFSDNSYGFRRMRGAHDAIKKGKGYYEEGNKYVVDIDMKA